MEVNFLVKIYTNDGREEKFDSKDVEDDLKAAGLPERVAKEVAERVEDRVQEGWTVAKVREETDIELQRLEEDIERAHTSFKGSAAMGTYNSEAKREINPNEPRTETKEVFRNVNA